MLPSFIFPVGQDWVRIFDEKSFTLSVVLPWALVDAGPPGQPWVYRSVEFALEERFAQGEALERVDDIGAAAVEELLKHRRNHLVRYEMRLRLNFWMCMQKFSNILLLDEVYA